ncbi:MAG TPA: MlaD family protein [Bryobacteraceae bacterium]|nr:MlaD family protein [Bryobacteraceae bacterium]
MSKRGNVLVGIFLLGGVLLFALGLFLIGNRRLLFEDSFHIHTEFAKLAGLANGAKVRVGGMDAGEVVSVNVPAGPGSKFRVRARITEKLHPLVRKDSVATIQTDGIVGNQFLQIGPGTEQAAPAVAEGTIPSREPFDFADLLQELQTTVKIANATILDLRGEVETVLHTINETAGEATDLIKDAGKDVKEIASSGAGISRDLGAIITDIRAGRGTVGKLVTDERLYSQIKGVANDLSDSSTNVRNATADIRKLTTDLRERQVMEEVEKTLKNVRQISDQVKSTLAKFQQGEGTADLTTDLRQTLAYAREAMQDMAENSEALKRNWFFRGFFRDRGFYDLDSVALRDYTGGQFARGKQVRREWVYYSSLFTPSKSGGFEISAEGKLKLDEVMGEFFRYGRDSFLIVEGYASEGTGSEQFLNSRRRARAVRDYLVSTYHINPSSAGTMPMGAVESSVNGKYWDGVAIALFYTGEPVPEKSSATTAP